MTIFHGRLSLRVYLPVGRPSGAVFPVQRGLHDVQAACQAANVNARHWAWECVDQAQRETVAALLRVSPNESNECLESIVAAMCNDKTQSEVFFGAFDYIKRAYKAQASDSGAS